MKIPDIDPIKTRKKLKLNQSAFWGRVQVTQSGGSRYEAGRDIPKPVQTLLMIAYGTDKQRQRMIAELTNMQGS